ncbi:MAG: MFS transporter [Chitinophagaceae bacterium]|nr:MFS transporter [Anaerolineae bacterium]
MLSRFVRRPGRVGLFVFVLLIIEFLDELVFGAREAAWPLIQADLSLTYVQIGIILTIPDLIASAIEPVMGILADMGKIRWLVLGGGLFFALALVIMALSPSFAVFLVASILLYPASGAFVSMSQIALMNTDPTRHEQNMARWTVAGSVAVLVGPLVLSVLIALGGGWRETFLIIAFLTVIVVVYASRFPFKNGAASDEEEEEPELSFRDGIKGAIAAVRNPKVLRWLVLLQCSDLLLDTLLAFLALYFVNVAQIAPERAALAVTVWTGVGLAGDFLLIPLLERVRGLDYLRISTLIEIALYPAFLLVDNFGLKLVILGLLGFFNAGSYSILQAGLYSTMPGRGGTVLAADNIFGLAGSLVPLGLGLVAQYFGLEATMWLLLIGPIGLIILLPRHAQSVSVEV